MSAAGRVSCCAWLGRPGPQGGVGGPARTEHGRFVFETRNPLVRAWEGWIPNNAVEVVQDGTVVRMAHEVETPVDGNVVSFTITFTRPKWDRPQVSRSTLRFLDAHS